jgi:hypothetical protein
MKELEYLLARAGELEAFAADEADPKVRARLETLAKECRSLAETIKKRMNGNH